MYIACIVDFWENNKMSSVKKKAHNKKVEAHKKKFCFKENSFKLVQ